MANKKVSELPAITSVQDADLLPVAASGTSYKATRLQLLTAGEVTGANGNNLTITGGDGEGTDKDGGSVVLVAGQDTGSGQTGTVNIIPGAHFSTGGIKLGGVAFDGTSNFDVGLWLNYDSSTSYDGTLYSVNYIQSAKSAPIATAVNGNNFNIIASDGQPGLSVAGAAKGGNISFVSGLAQRLTSGNANGGDIFAWTQDGIGTGRAGNFVVKSGVGPTNYFAVVPGSNQISLGSGQSFGWSSTTDATAVIDTAFTRSSAGVITCPTILSPLNVTGGGDTLSITQDASTSTFSGAAGDAVLIKSTVAAQIAGAQAGQNLSLLSSDAIAGSSVVGAAAGGSISITAGNAARLTSGNASGGDINLVPGEGIGSGTGGSISAMASEAGDTGIGGSVYIVGGRGGVTSGKGGTVYLEAGSGQGGNANGGDISLNPGFPDGVGTPGKFYVEFVTRRLAAVPNLNQISLGSDQSFGWSSTTDATAAIDTGLIRLGAASVKITDGAAGTGSLTANIDAANVNSGTLNTARLGSGVADNTKFLRGDSTWQVFTTGTVTNVSATLPVTSTGGATPDIGFNNSNILAQQWFGG